MHERDAVACAIKAYHNYQNKFRQIDATLKSTDLAGREEQVKGMVLEGFSLQNALLDIQAEREISQVPDVKVPLRPAPEIDLAKKNEKIRELLHSNIELRKSMERLETEKKTLQEKMLELEKGIYERVTRDREIRKRDVKIKILSMRRGKKSKPSGVSQKNPAQDQKQQSDLKTLGGKSDDDKSVDIDSIILRYRQKSMNR